MIRAPSDGAVKSRAPAGASGPAGNDALSFVESETFAQTGQGLFFGLLPSEVKAALLSGRA
jgi:hypothetical protein